ncbi:uncharacterized protein A4U43_C03F21360 [Asparagus officinalis]|uniref:BHLH domain-containing protein n=1 Tax=Asparagus officinalis TaxID=4686 RepID=A0A5P1FBX2_ASPOF|nr:transcription factor bHLH113-like [Asparagus officinalis]ONK75865.1 uncharacterized protein A4U43_C03F21360 [Asparagus officinalis]
MESEEASFMELLGSELLYLAPDHGVCEKLSLNSSLTFTQSSSSSSTTSSTAEEVTTETKAHKKQKKGPSAYLSTIKVKKDKLRDRISTLQQLVSPFCKSDTASVLHEALGYIKFLHDQVQVLSSPYLQPSLPKTASLQDEEQRTSDLRSRGLCLVPISRTENVANDNGADIWSSSTFRGSINLYST